MKGWMHRGMAVFFVGIFVTGALGGCGILRSTAAEKELVVSEGTDRSGSVADEKKDFDGDLAGSVAVGSEDKSDSGDSSDEASVSASDEAEQTTIYVYICGQVKEEGVYRMPSDCRVYQVIEEAGGVTEKADISAVNQAARVEDGEKIYIPEEGEAGAGQLPDAESASDASGDGKVNINTADKEELMTLNGIGESRAESIMQYREEHGSFARPEDLKNVSGIGDGIYGKIEEDICV